MRVIGFTGMPGSGKSEAMDVARARGIPVVRMGDLIWEEVERRGLPRDAKHVGEVANAMRQEHGKDVWSRRTVTKVRHVAAGLKDSPMTTKRGVSTPKTPSAGPAGTPGTESGKPAVPVVLIDGIRNHEEVDTFRRELGDDFILVAIHTDPEHRHQRMLVRARPDDGRDEATLAARDERELGWGIARTIALADEMLVNDGSLDVFRDRVGEMLERLLDPDYEL